MSQRVQDLPGRRRARKPAVAFLPLLLLAVATPASSEQTPAPFTWTRPAGATIWNLSAPIDLGIVLGPAHQVRIGSCQLVEQTDKLPLDCGRLQLCAQPTSGQSVNCPKGSEGLDVGAGGNTISMRLEEGYEPVGNYKGIVLVTALEKPAGQPIQLELYGRSSSGMALGVLCLALGVAVAWALSVFARTRIDRDQALIPAVLLSTRLAKLLATLGQAPTAWTSIVAGTAAAARRLQESLTEQYLDSQGWLPPRVPSPYSPTYNPSHLNLHLEQVSQSTSVLEIVVDGMVRAWSLDQPGLTPQQHQAVGDALTQLDALAVAPTNSQAQQGVEGILAKLRANLAAPAAAAAGTAAGATLPPAAPAATSKGLSLQIATFTWIIWGVLFATTILTGLAAVILPKPGFGLARDYLICFLWGLGLPVAGMQLTALVPSSVSSALRMTVFR